MTYRQPYHQNWQVVNVCSSRWFCLFCPQASAAGWVGRGICWGVLRLRWPQSRQGCPHADGHRAIFEFVEPAVKCVSRRPPTRACVHDAVRKVNTNYERNATKTRNPIFPSALMFGMSVLRNFDEKLKRAKERPSRSSEPKSTRPKFQKNTTAAMSSPPRNCTSSNSRTSLSSAAPTRTNSTFLPLTSFPAPRPWRLALTLAV